MFVRVFKIAADVLVWTLAVLGVVCVGVWGATAMGLIKPLVVVSGSMEPGIKTGDLLVATPVPIEEVEVGDVLSLPNPVTDVLVSHRVIDLAQQPDGSWHVYMQGDANDSPDGGEYVVTDDTVLAPRWQLAGVGDALTRLTAPSTAVPLGIALAALLALSLLPRPASHRADPPSGAQEVDGAPRPVPAGRP